MTRWNPKVKCSERELRLLKLAGKSRKLFVFLREHRHELFDDAFQAELEGMYRQTGQGETPQPPALMCMGLLLQAYLQTSDAEAVRLSASDLQRSAETTHPCSSEVDHTRNNARRCVLSVRGARMKHEAPDSGGQSRARTRRQCGLQPVGSRSVGPVILTVWHWWRSRPSSASTRLLLPRKLPHSL